MGGLAIVLIALLKLVLVCEEVLFPLTYPLNVWQGFLGRLEWMHLQSDASSLSFTCVLTCSHLVSRAT